MSPKVQVSNLSSLCLKTISRQCIQVLSDDERNYNNIVTGYLENATNDILQNLLTLILNKHDLDASTRYSCLEVLLRHDVKKLNTRIFPRYYYEKILQVISLKGTQLYHLDLKGVWVKDYPKLLQNLVLNLQELRSLVIPHMADDGVLDAIVRLKYLVVLDISGEACYTVSGIKKLKMPQLKILEIGNYGKINLSEEENSGIDLVAELLENLPNLTHLKVYSFTGGALLRMYDKDINKKTKLTYLRDTGTSMESIKALQHVAPELYNIYIDNADVGVVEELCKFKKLKKVKLIKPNGDAIINYLKTCGHQLLSLNLNHNISYSLDLSQICLTSPNLTNLESFQMKLIFSNVDTYFMCLQNIELIYCEVSDRTIRYLLTNSPFLKRIVVGCPVAMTDGDIFRLCAECDFFNLEELWFSYARGLTTVSVELLMNHCSNLKVIGQLGEWNIQVNELDYLRSIIASTNTNLKLLASGIYPAY